MGVWDRVGDPELLARYLQHPAHTAVTSVIAERIEELRGTDSRDDLRSVQERLIADLLGAELEFRAQSRLKKKGRGDPTDLDFWRRTCKQLRAVGDAIAWRFLAYRRQWILLLGRNQHPGLMSDKAGFASEVQLFSDHWDAGEPTLLTGLTNCITACDLLVARNDTLWTIEVKKDPSRRRPEQMERLRTVGEQLSGRPVIRVGGEEQWVVESDVRLRSSWSEAEEHVRQAAEDGVAFWVPTEGVAVQFAAPFSAAARGREAVIEAFARGQAEARRAMGAGEHAVIANGFDYPYRTSRTVPASMYPLAADLAAMVLTGGIQFRTEVHIERLMAALADAGLDPVNLLEGLPSPGPVPDDLIRWVSRDSPSRRGTIHSATIQDVAIDLTDPDAWATSMATAVQPDGASSRFGLYVCLAGEEDVWAKHGPRQGHG